MPLPPPVVELPARLVAGAVVLPNREAILPLLPKGGVIAEVGVALGDFSDLLLRVCAPSRFIAIDTFGLHMVSELWGTPTAARFTGRTHLDAYRARFATEIAAGQVQTIAADSADGLLQLEDASLDIAYIDADHSVESVRRDLAAAVRKVRPDGYIVLNDYILVDQLEATVPYGVIHAAHEFMIEHDWAMIYLALHAWMFCDVVLRRAGLGDPTWRRMAQLEGENAALRARVAALESSTSWQLTAPLRAVRRLVGHGG